MAKLLFPDQDRIRGNKTSAECEYALAMLLNFLAFPKREYSEMAQIWQMDRRAISEYVLVLMDWGVIAGIQSLTRPFNPHPMPHSILCATTRAILKRWYHLLWPGDISRIRANLHKWRRAICSTLRLAEEDYLNVFGFIDGTARRTNRPWGMSIFQQALYDGHHCYHGFDYEGVTSPDGLIIRLFGPVSARHFHSALLPSFPLPARSFMCAQTCLCRTVWCVFVCMGLIGIQHTDSSFFPACPHTQRTNLSE